MKTLPALFQFKNENVDPSAELFRLVQVYQKTKGEPFRSKKGSGSIEISIKIKLGLFWNMVKISTKVVQG